jgi:hypothetical protein
MYLLDKIHEFNNSESINVKIVESEYEILSRVHLTGVLEFPGVYYQFWESPDFLKSKNQVRSSYLKILDKVENNTKQQIPIVSNKRQEYYIPGGIANEIAVLMTLFTRAHFVLSRSLKEHNIVLMQKYFGAEYVGFSQVDGSKIALGDIKKYFDLLEGLSLLETNTNWKCRRIEPFMLAARMYYLAILLMKQDETLAYISLVNAIECLIHDFPIYKSLMGINRQAANLIKSKVSDKDYQEIELVLLKSFHCIKKRFMNFVVEHIADDYWNNPNRPVEVYRKIKNKKELREYLGRIYDARSSFLHTGNLFPPSGFYTEKPVGSSLQIGNKKWKEKQLLPSVKIFELIVHHVLIEYLKQESSKGFKNK